MNYEKYRAKPDSAAALMERARLAPEEPDERKVKLIDARDSLKEALSAVENALFETFGVL